MRVAVGLLHWPINDRTGKVVATNITNLDVHDIARASRVYGVESYYLIHPMQEQLMFVSRMLEHWRIGEGSRFNPMRKTALTMVETAESLDAALKHWGGQPVIVGTSAREIPGVDRISFKALREKMVLQEPESVFLLFGTGFGVTEEVLKRCHFLLEPLKGVPPDDYRHLSVRSAVSICLDRLLGSW